MTIEQRDQPQGDLPAKLAAPARRALVGAGYLRLEQLTGVSEAEIKQLHGIGANALDQLRRALADRGLSFGVAKGNDLMDEVTRTNLNNLRSQDRDLQNRAFFAVLEATDQPVDWAYEVWDNLVRGLSDKDNHVRAIAAQVLCSLARSDPENRMLRDFEALLAVTRDERFVTARHCLQALWKVGVAGQAQQTLLVEGLERRFNECITEKNCTLIRYDIIQSLRNVYDQVGDEAIREKALALIETEADLKYRKKYARLF